MILLCPKYLYITRICPNFCVLGGETAGIIVVVVVVVVALAILGVFLYKRQKSESFM